jgi:hypothetical protein
MIKINVSKKVYWLTLFVLLLAGLTVDAAASGGPAPLPGPTGVTVNR